MRPRCAVPAGEPPGELAVDCACKCAAKKLPAARSRRKSAGAARPVCCASTRLAAPTAVRSWLDSRTLHRQPIAQTKDTTVSSKFPASCPAWYFHSWVGASIEIDTLGVKKRSHSSRSSAGGGTYDLISVRRIGCAQADVYSWLRTAGFTALPR